MRREIVSIRDKRKIGEIAVDAYIDGFGLLVSEVSVKLNADENGTLAPYLRDKDIEVLGLPLTEDWGAQTADGKYRIRKRYLSGDYVVENTVKTVLYAIANVQIAYLRAQRKLSNIEMLKEVLA